MATLEIPEGWYDSYISGLYASLLDSYDEETAKITFNAIVANHATQEEIDALDELLMEVELHDQNCGFLDNVEEARRLFEEKACNLAEVICLNPKIMRLICSMVESRCRIARLNYALVSQSVDEDDNSVRYCTWDVFITLTEKQRSTVRRISELDYAKVDWSIASHVKEWTTSNASERWFLQHDLDWLDAGACWTIGPSGTVEDISHAPSFDHLSRDVPKIDVIRCKTLSVGLFEFSESAPILQVTNLQVGFILTVIDFFVPPSVEVLYCDMVLRFVTSLRGETLMARYREWRGHFKMAKFNKVYVQRDVAIDGYEDVADWCSSDDIEIDSSWNNVDHSIDKVALAFM